MPKYSPIFSPSEPPVKLGWYVSSTMKDVIEDRYYGSSDLLSEYLWYWNGKRWYLDDTCRTVPVLGQKRFWFGLVKDAS